MRSSTLPRSEPERAELERILRRLESAGDTRRVVRLVEAWDREGTVSLAAGLSQARAFLDLRLMDRAWVRLRELDQAHPDDADVVALTARVFVARGWPARARKVVERLRSLAPEHADLARLEEQVAGPPQGPPGDAKEIERRGDPDELLALAESYLATGSFLRAKSILERVRRARPLDGRVDLLLWGLQGDFLSRGTTLADLVADAQPITEWDGVENTESVRRPDLLSQADPPTAEVTRSMLVEAGMLEPPGEDRFPSLFRRVSDGKPGGELSEDDDITVSAGLASPAELAAALPEEHTDPGVAGSGLGEDAGGDTQIMQVIPGPGGHRLGEVEGPIHREAEGGADGLRETLDLRAWQESMGMSAAKPEDVDEEGEDFLEAEDEDLVVMTRREDPVEAPAASRSRKVPIEVIEKHPVPDVPPAPEPEPVEADLGPDLLTMEVEPLEEEPEPVAASRSTGRLVATIGLMAVVMGGATALVLRYLHDVVSAGQIEEAERSLAAGDYRGLLELEARLDSEVRAEVAPLGARAVALALVDAVLWGEYTGNPDQRSRAVEAIEQARKSGADSKDLALAEGMLALLSGDLATAAERSAVAGVDDEAGRYLAARLALARGEAAVGLEQWGEGGSGVRHRLLGEALLRSAGQSEAAAREAAEIRQAAPDNPLVIVAAATGGWDAADPLARVGEIDRLVQEHRDDLAPRQVGALYAEKARLLESLGKDALALDAWKRSSSVDSTHPEALRALAAADLAAGKVEAALAGLQDCARFNPAVFGCQRGLVQAYLELDQVQQASAVVDAWPGPDEDTAALEGWVAVADDRGEAAKADLVAHVEASSALGDGVALYALGLLLAAEPEGGRNAERSLELAVQALSRSDDPFDALLVDRARAARVEVVDEAQVEGVVRELLAGDTQDPAVYVHIARRYEALGRRSAAAQYFEKATRLAPHSAWAWYEQGQFYFAPSTMDKAMSAWRRYLDLQPSSQRAERTRSRLK